MVNISIHIVNKKSRKVINLPFPQNWNEVKRSRFLNSAELLFSKKMDTYQVKSFLFCRISGLKYSKFISIFKKAYSDPDAAWEEGVELIQTIELVDPLLEEIHLKKSHLKSYWLWQGPSERLENITLNRWKYIDPYFTATMEGGIEPHLLDEFISLLYKPFFLPWNERLTETYKNLIRKWPRKLKLAMLLNYIGIRNALAKEFDLVFSKPPSNSSKDFDPLWVQKLIYDLPSEKFGELKKIGNLKVPDALEFMQYIIEKEKAK